MMASRSGCPGACASSRWVMSLGWKYGRGTSNSAPELFLPSSEVTTIGP